MSSDNGSKSPLNVVSSQLEVSSAIPRKSKRLAAVAGSDMSSGSRLRSARNRVKSARPTSEIASSCETSSSMSAVVERLNSLRTTLEIQPRFVIAACGRTLPSRANTVDLAPSLSSQRTQA